MKHKPGIRVRVEQDCRTNPTATGQEGIFEGHFIHPELQISNPRLKLDNGEIIWGIECWWKPIDELPKIEPDRNNTSKRSAKSKVFYQKQLFQERYQPPKHTKNEEKPAKQRAKKRAETYKGQKKT